MQRFGRGPGYPVFLAPLTWLDADLRAGRLPAGVPAAVKIVQAILGAAAILVLAGLVRRVAGDRAGAAAAWIAALFPPLVWMPAYALSEQLASVLALGCAAWLGAVTDGTPAARGRPRRHHARARGRRPRRRRRRADPPGTAVLPAAGGAAAVLAGARSPHRAAPRRSCSRSLALAAIAPWTVRNAIVHRQFVPIASSGGVNFWIGNHREAIGDGDLAANPHLKLRNAEFRARHAGLSEEALEPLYYREALRLHRRRSGVVARARGPKALVHLRAVRAVVPAARAALFLGVGGVAAPAPAGGASTGSSGPLRARARPRS